MAVFNEPTKWQTSLVNSGDANVIPQSTPVGTGEASFDDGFPQITQIPIGAGGIAPDRKDFNGLFKILGDWIFFNQNGGLPTYSADFDYVAGRVVLYNDNIYKCIQANGASSTVVAPDSVSPLGSDYWAQVATLADFISFADKDFSNVTAPTQAFKDMSTSWGMPDLSAGVSVTTPYTTVAYGWLFLIFELNGSTSAYYKINGKTVFSLGLNGNYMGVSAFVPISKGDVLTRDGSSSSATSIFYPCKGAN